MRATVLLALAASAMSYHISTPNEDEGWSCNSANKVTWEKVSSDPPNCNMMLTNQDRDTLARPMMLKRNVNGNDRSATIEPPAEGWPEGTGYQINMEYKRGGILAQSKRFDIQCPEATTPKSTPDTSESQSEPKTEIKTEPKTEPKTQPKTQPKPEPESFDDDEF